MKRNKWIDGVNHSLHRHLRKRIRERNIAMHQVWTTAEDPDTYEELHNDSVRVSKMYDDDKLILVMHAIGDFIMITTAFWEEDYTEDARAQNRAKHIKGREQHNRRLTKHDHRFRKRQRNAPS